MDKRERATVCSASGTYGAGFRSSGVANVPGLCCAILTAKPRASSNITIEAWLPAEDTWNGKLPGTGNGAFGGSIATESLIAAVKRDYAGADTDMVPFPPGCFPIPGMTLALYIPRW